MTDPGLELQGAIVAALKAADVCAGRVYDHVPAGAQFPYVNIGEVQVNDDEAECIESVEVFVTLHTWSRSVGKPEASAINAQVRAALHNANLTLSTWRFLEIRQRDARTFTDGDGITTHGISVFRALVDPA